MPKCPYCITNNFFKTNKGLRIHITKMHTTKIGNIKIVTKPF